MHGVPCGPEGMPGVASFLDEALLLLPQAAPAQTAVPSTAPPGALQPSRAPSAACLHLALVRRTLLPVVPA